jgi:hypothetical protein
MEIIADIIKVYDETEDVFKWAILILNIYVMMKLN